MGSVSRLGPRRYRAWAEHRADGKRLRTTKTFTTAAAAKTWIRETEDDLRAVPSATPVYTIAHLADRWLAAKEHEIRPTTHAAYSTIINRLIRPQLGDILASDLRPFHVQAWIDDQIAAGTGRVSVLHATKRLSTILDHAVRLELIPTNPVKAVDRPKQPPPRQAVLSRDELTRFLAAAESDHFYPLWHILALAGLRRGEAFALRWQDVDFHQRQIHVRQSLTVHKAQLRIEQPKTAAGRRTIAVPDALIAALRQHKDRQAFHAAKLGELWLDRDLVICTETGSLHNPANCYDHFAAIIRRAEVPPIRLHDLRHTFASHLINAGIPLPIVASQLGHASPAITMSVYAHMIPKDQRQAADAIDRLLSSGN